MATDHTNHPSPPFIFLNTVVFRKKKWEGVFDYEKWDMKVYLCSIFLLLGRTDEQTNLLYRVVALLIVLQINFFASKSSPLHNWYDWESKFQCKYVCVCVCVVILLELNCLTVKVLVYLDYCIICLENKFISNK